MDPDACIRRRPDVLIVDELPHTNAPGCRHEKRWQDVEEILNAHRGDIDPLAADIRLVVQELIYLAALK